MIPHWLVRHTPTDRQSYFLRSLYDELRHSWLRPVWTGKFRKSSVFYRVGGLMRCCDFAEWQSMSGKPLVDAGIPIEWKHSRSSFKSQNSEVTSFRPWSNRITSLIAGGDKAALNYNWEQILLWPTLLQSERQKSVQRSVQETPGKTLQTRADDDAVLDFKLLWSRFLLVFTVLIIFHQQPSTSIKEPLQSIRRLENREASNAFTCT